MDKKAVVVGAMQVELDNAHNGNVEPIAGEDYMTVENVYYMMKTTFEKVFIPEHVLDIFMLQEFPLSKFYDYFADHDGFRHEVDWEQFCREYSIYRECEYVEERLHRKVEAEYKTFMEAQVDKAPYNLEKAISEISFKMQVFSIFRYKGCFGMGDMRVLQEVDNLMDKTYTKHNGELLISADEKYLWAQVMECLGKVVEDERVESEAEEDALET